MTRACEKPARLNYEQQRISFQIWGSSFILQQIILTLFLLINLSEIPKAMQFEFILQRMDWVDQPFGSILCLTDDGSTEQLRWQLSQQSDRTELRETLKTLLIADFASLEVAGFSNFNFKYLVCYFADCNWSTLHRLKRLLLNSDVRYCAIVVYQADFAMSLALDLTSESVQEAISDTLFPTKITLFFQPNSLICIAENYTESPLLNSLSFHVFSSYRMRKLRPLTLSSIHASDADYQRYVYLS